MKKAFKSNNFVLIVLIAVLLAGFACINPAVLSTGNIFNMISSATMDAIFALSVLLVTVSGGVDLSFMSIASFTMFTTTKILLSNGLNPPVIVVFLMGIAMGVLLGCLNAFFVNAIHLPVFIVTLATQFLFGGGVMAFVGTGKQVVPKNMANFGKLALFSAETAGGATTTLRATVLIMICMYVLVYLLLKYTRIGRNFYLIGGDAQAAQRMGVNVQKTYYLLFILTGAICGIGGIANACTLRTVVAGDLIGSEMPIIAAVIIGGGDSSEGKGTVFGTLLGVVLMTVISNNLTIIRVPSYWKELVMGMFIMVGTISQVLRARKKA